MLQYLIVADDFTGSCDAGLQLSRFGLSTRVQIGKAQDLCNSVDALVLDTESRNTDKEHAKMLVRNALGSIDPNADYMVIKKIDSTLRGNIVDEVLEVATYFDVDTIVVAPSFPDQGRTVVDGVLYVRSKRLLETEHGKDPIKAVTEDNIVTLFSSQNLYAVKPFTGKAEEGKRQLYVCDASSNEELRDIVKCFSEQKSTTLYVGSAGIADALVASQATILPSLGIVASLSDTTRKQVLHAQGRGIYTISVSVEDLLLEKDLQHVQNEALKQLFQGNDVLVCIASVLEPKSYQTKHENLSESQIALKLKTGMSNLAKQIILRSKICGVFLTGGDMANGVLEALGVSQVSLLGEVSLGIPLMKVVGTEHEDLKIITKAGAFGSEDAITYAMRVLKAQ